MESTVRGCGWQGDETMTMKVKVFERYFVGIHDIKTDHVRDLLEKNGMSIFEVYREKIVDIPLTHILDNAVSTNKFALSNSLHTIIHKEHSIYSCTCNLEYEIVDERYPCDIPYCDEVISTEGEFDNWLRKRRLMETN